MIIGVKNRACLRVIEHAKGSYTVHVKQVQAHFIALDTRQKAHRQLVSFEGRVK